MSELRKQMIDELTNSVMGVDIEQIDAVIALIENAKKIFFFARRRELTLLGGFGMRVYHMGYDAYVSGEAHNPAIGQGDLLIAVNGDGQDDTTAVQLEAAKQAGATVALVTAHAQSTLGQMSDLCLELPANACRDSSGALQSMGAAFEQCMMMTLDYIVVRMMENHSWQEEDLSRRHANLQ